MIARKIAIGFLIFAGIVGLAVKSGKAQRRAEWVERAKVIHGPGPAQLSYPDVVVTDKPVLGAEVLTPGGIYTQADIDANGNTTPYETYARTLIDPGFSHIEPELGGMRCPVTGANGAMNWVVNGETYKFCCVPCIIDFVRMAKTSPEKIKPPEEYLVTAENIDDIPVTLGPGMQMGNAGAP